MSLVDSLGALGERQFRLLWAGQTFSNLGSALVPIALAFAVLDLTGSATDLGLVLLASRLPQVLLVLAGGVVGDRLPRRRVMLASDLARCATQATTALLLASGTARLWQLLALQAAHGAAAAFFDPAATGLVPQTVGPGRLQHANALMGLSRSASGIGGQVGAGVLAATAGPAAALAVDAGSFAVSAWSLALLRPVGTVRIGQDTSFLAQLAAGWAEFRSRSWLWASVLHLSLLNLVVLAPFFVLGPLVALRSLGGPTAWAAIATAYASGAVAGGLVGLRWRPRRPLLAATLEITDLDRRQVAERRRGEAWFPDAFAALERIWSGDATAADWTAIAPFTYGRWDAVSQAHLAREASQKNAEAAAVYYSAGAIDPEATRTSLARLRAPVLVVAGEYDVALPPKCAAEYAGLFRQAELVVQPGGGHFPWLDDPEWFVQTLAGFLR